MTHRTGAKGVPIEDALALCTLVSADEGNSMVAAGARKLVVSHEREGTGQPAGEPIQVDRHDERRIHEQTRGTHTGAQ